MPWGRGRGGGGGGKRRRKREEGERGRGRGRLPVRGNLGGRERWVLGMWEIDGVGGGSEMGRGGQAESRGRPGARSAGRGRRGWGWIGAARGRTEGGAAAVRDPLARLPRARASPRSRLRPPAPRIQVRGSGEGSVPETPAGREAPGSLAFGEPPPPWPVRGRKPWSGGWGVGGPGRPGCVLGAGGLAGFRAVTVTWPSAGRTRGPAIVRRVHLPRRPVRGASFVFVSLSFPVEPVRAPHVPPPSPRELAEGAPGTHCPPKGEGRTQVRPHKRLGCTRRAPLLRRQVSQPRPEPAGSPSIPASICLELSFAPRVRGL